MKVEFAITEFGRYVERKPEREEFAWTATSAGLAIGIRIENNTHSVMHFTGSPVVFAN